MPAKHLVSALALVSFLSVAARDASAVNLNPRGVGQALVYPYYTVNENQDTLVSVVNASDVSKAVQVRILEGQDGRDALAFLLFLSPHDVWTASITRLANGGGAVLKTSDASCTLPAIPASGVTLRAVDFDGTGATPADGGPHDVSRTFEGMLDFIVGADITPRSPTDVAIESGCASLNGDAALADEVAPTGGIFGSGSIVNVGEGTFFAYNADAIDGFTSIPLFTSASISDITLADANSSEAVNGTATAYVAAGNGASLALDYASGIDAVSAVFMADTIYNEYVVASSLGTSTDWVVTFPTKAFYVDPQYGTVPLAPFTDAFQAPGLSAVDVAGDIYDRQGGSTSFGECSNECPRTTLSYQVNVLPFRNNAAPAPSGVFGSSLVSLSIPPYADAGDVVLDLAAPNDITHALPGGIDHDGSAVTLSGLPVTGFMAYNVVNANAQPGTLANYSGAFPHRAATSCQGNVSGCAPTTAGSGAGN